MFPAMFFSNFSKFCESVLATSFYYWSDVQISFNLYGKYLT